MDDISPALRQIPNLYETWYCSRYSVPQDFLPPAVGAAADAEYSDGLWA